jgi:hypothetical protein
MTEPLVVAALEVEKKIFLSVFLRPYTNKTFLLFIVFSLCHYTYIYSIIVAEVTILFRCVIGVTESLHILVFLVFFFLFFVLILMIKI